MCLKHGSGEAFHGNAWGNGPQADAADERTGPDPIDSLSLRKHFPPVHSQVAIPNLKLLM
jgi:hypothetical protein